MNLDCPYCSRSLQADDSIVGGKAKCPFCGQKFLVDYTGRCNRMDDLVVFCPDCSERIVLGRESLGVKSACPVCGRHFIVPAGEGVPPASGAAATPGEAYVAPQIVLEAGDVPLPPPPPPPPPPGPVSSRANRIADICILATVICFILFCVFRCADLWAHRGTQRGMIQCASIMKQMAAECRAHAEDHQNRLPSAEEWEGIVKKYLPDAKSVPCVEHYRYNGAGRMSGGGEKEAEPVIFCDTHKAAVSLDGQFLR